MPQIFKLGEYVVYFWIGEGRPLEPIHVHVSSGHPTENSTKIWLTKSGYCLLANNNSKISPRNLRIIEGIIEARYKEIVQKWIKYFGEISYYC